MNEVEFLNNHCKVGEHNSCRGAWLGLGFRANCQCSCHEKKNNATDGIGKPDSAALGIHLMEVTNGND